MMSYLEFSARFCRSRGAGLVVLGIPSDARVDGLE